MMGLFQKSGLNFIALPTENAYLQGRQDTYPKRRGLTRLKELWKGGVNVCFGQDSINDPWYPAGNGNLMNILDNGIHRTDHVVRSGGLFIKGGKEMECETNYQLSDLFIGHHFCVPLTAHNISLQAKL